MTVSDSDILDPVYTVPDPHGDDIKLDSFKMSVGFRYNNMREFNNN